MTSIQNINLAITGWNTWDIQFTNGFVHLPSCLRLRVSLLNPLTGETCESFRWNPNLVRAGLHSGDGRYMSLTLRWEQLHFLLEFSARGDDIICQVTPSSADSGLMVRVILDWAWNSLETDATVYHLRCAPTVLDRHKVTGVETLDFPFTQSITVTCGLNAEWSPDEAVKWLNEQRASASARRFQTGGWLGSAADGLTRVIRWNTIYEPKRERLCTPVSRDWCTNLETGFGNYVLFEWDTFFCALMAQTFDPALASANISAILQEASPHGFIPNFGAGNGASEDRSQPPVGAYVVLKQYHSSALDDTHKNRLLLETSYEALVRWHEWWLPHRDGNGDGLLEWGSDPLPPDVRNWGQHDLYAAMLESGLDNSPMWDDIIFNPQTHTMQLAAVCLNALYALDAWALAQIAALLDRPEDVARFEGEYDRMRTLVNQQLWDEQTGIYRNQDWAGQLSPVLSSTLFFPLLAGIVPPERAERMVRDHLMNPEEFLGTHGVPTVARSEASYADQTYWRGRIWAPHVFLINEGLRRTGFYAEAHELARRSLNTFLIEWEDHGHVHENLNAETGQGEGQTKAYSDPFYTWGALMGYTAIQELVDAEPWGGWRFGNFSPEQATVDHLMTAEGNLSVETSGSGLRVMLDNHLIVVASGCALIREYRLRAGTLHFSVMTAEPGTTLVRVGQLNAHTTYHVTSGDQTWEAITSTDGELAFTLTTPASVDLALAN